MIRWLSVFTLCFIAAGISLKAELPPSAYEKMQSQAAEVLRIKVLQVDVSPGADESIQEVTTLAQILKVGRSASNAKAEDLITIKYSLMQRPAGWVGPGEVPVLEVDKETVAYLKPISGTPDYAPAAGAMSFDRFN